MGARVQRTVRFGWNVANATDGALHNRLLALKEEGQMVPTIRQALLLLFTLQDGDLGQLEKQFPEIVEHLIGQGAREERERQNRDLAIQTGKLSEKIIHFEDMLKKASLPPRASPELDRTRTFGGGFRQLPTPAADDDMKVEVRKAKGTNSALNFLKALDGVNGTNLAQPEEPRRPKRDAKTPAGNAKKMDVPTLDLPAFDDDDDFDLGIKPVGGD